jgi:zinc transport system substrate-binding protein
MKKKLQAVLAAMVIVAGAFPAAAKTAVFVSVLPQKFFAEQVGGERVEVSVLVGKNRDPHTFEPLPAQMAALSRADGYLSIGLPFEESLLPRIRQLNPSLRVFAADRGIERIRGKDEEHHGRTDEHGHEHDHGGSDPHVWNGVREARTIAENTCAALAELDPEGSDHYRRNLGNFLERLDALDAEFRELFRGREGAAFLVFHPAWGYLAREYGLEEVAIETDGKEPKAADMAAVITEAKQRGVKVVFVSPQFSGRSAEIIARSIGATVETVNPLSEEWEENIRAAARAIAESAR